jgi:thymidylate synthase
LKILILKSIQTGVRKNTYSVSMDTEYVNRFLGHLTNQDNYCHSCYDKCVHCRKSYDLDFTKNIEDIISFPSTLPAILEDPETFLPDTIPEHDILIPISVNEEILISFIHKFPVSKGIIVPIESSTWISPYGIEEITKKCEKYNIEIAFPKPFCSFLPEKGILLKFYNKFKIGKPEIKFIKNNKGFSEFKVLKSAPCGATYYTVSCLNKADSSDDPIFIIEKSLSCYPCTASRLYDKEFNDSIMHQAVKMQRDLLNRH